MVICLFGFRSNTAQVDLKLTMFKGDLELLFYFTVVVVVTYVGED